MTIHIKPENRGKFNATKKRTGKTTEELTHSKNPVTRKRAVFAQNASHWNANGGFLVSGTLPGHQEFQHNPEYVGYGSVNKLEGKKGYIPSYNRQYGFGSWLKKNAGAIGTVTGAGLGMLFGMPGLGASLGGSIGGGIQGNYQQGQQAEMMAQQQAAMLEQQKQQAKQISDMNVGQARMQGLQPQQTYGAMANGGYIKSYRTGGFMGNIKNNPDVVYFPTGGSHESNKRGGIQLGGKGKVEEGEFKVRLKKGEYIFSNRF